MASPSAIELRQRLDDQFDAHDREGAIATALEAVDSGALTITELYTDVLNPLLVDVGAAWRAGTVSVWQEHLISQSVRTIIEAMWPRVESLAVAPSECASTAVLAAPAGEQHDLGLRMVADLMRLAGWRIVYLGPDTPTGEIVAAVQTVGADAIVLTASTHFQRLELRHIIDEACAALPGTKALVGGAAFAREHAGWDDDEVLDLAAITTAAAATCALREDGGR